MEEETVEELKRQLIETRGVALEAFQLAKKFAQGDVDGGQQQADELFKKYKKLWGT